MYIISEKCVAELCAYVLNLLVSRAYKFNFDGDLWQFNYLVVHQSFSPTARVEDFVTFGEHLGGTPKSMAIFQSDMLLDASLK